MKDVYRQCASAVIFRLVDGQLQVLLVHKPRKKDAWQLPQGGVEEGESVEEAAIRELKEETDLDASVIKKSSVMYQYHFPNSYRRFRPDNVCGQQIHFVYSELISDPDSVHVDNVEINDYVWADLKNVNKYIKRKEYREIVDKLIAGRVQ